MPPKKRGRGTTAKNDQATGDTKEAKEVKKSIQEKIKKSGAMASKSIVSSSKVDPLCPMASKCSIYTDENGVAWECMLNQTNIQNNNNKYFLLQVLTGPSSNQYHTWFRWGRVGYDGQKSLSHFGSIDAAKSCFEKKFSDKTKNKWEDKDDFVKVPGKYELVDVKVAVDEPDKAPKKKKQKIDVKVLESQLHKKVQELIELICDKGIMEETLKTMKFDVDKAPLGKVTEDQIKAGYQALSKIADVINKKGPRNQLLDACNEFYTRIPHYFGMKVPPTLNTLDEVKAKIELLEALSDIQQGMKALDENENAEEEDEEEEVKEVPSPIDLQYKRLNVKLDPLEQSSEDFKLLEKYIKSTHGSTHSTYKMNVEEIFICEKDLAFKDKGNRMLLFHGSRMSNFAGILSQGLRIAPPEAPVTGYMFGKGCYFADMSSKSANYCWATRSQPKGLLLLCEVALGQSNDLLQADYNANKLPKGKNSVKGVGKVRGKPENYHTMEDGTIVPLGPADTQDVPGGSLIYNEYIVYDTAQVRLRYLAKINFKFQY